MVTIATERRHALASARTWALVFSVILPITCGCGGGTNFTERALAKAGEQAPSGDKVAEHEPGSRNDFLQAIQVCGGNVGHRFEKDGVEFVQVYLRLTQSEWEEVFGRFERLADGYDSWKDGEYQKWKYDCTDGPITFTGDIVDYPDKTMVIAAGAYFSDGVTP